MATEWEVASQTPTGQWEVASHTPTGQPGFWSTLGHDINPMNSIPALASGIGNALTGKSLAAGVMRPDLTPVVQNGTLVAPPSAAVTPEALGHAAASVVNGGLLAAVAPPVMNKIGGLLKSGAVPVAESALGVRNMDRGFDKTPGDFALSETSGLHPDAVSKSAGSRVKALTNELESRVNASTTPGSLQPARDVIDQRAATAAAGNSTSAGKELAPMRAQLTNPQPGFAGVIDPATGEIAVDQSPANILRMKREFGTEFTRWNMLNPASEMSTARKAYGALDSELDRTVPGASEIDQKISSGIPVRDRAAMQNLNAGPIQQLLHKFAAPTGALLSGAAGYHEGGLLGAAAGTAIPLALASPTVRMAAARGIYGAGGLLANTTAQKAAQAALIASMAKRRGLLDVSQRSNITGGLLAP